MNVLTGAYFAALFIVLFVTAAIAAAHPRGENIIHMFGSACTGVLLPGGYLLALRPVITDLGGEYMSFLYFDAMIAVVTLFGVAIGIAALRAELRGEELMLIPEPQSEPPSQP